MSTVRCTKFAIGQLFSKMQYSRALRRRVVRKCEEMQCSYGFSAPTKHREVSDRGDRGEKWRNQIGRVAIIG